MQAAPAQQQDQDEPATAQPLPQRLARLARRATIVVGLGTAAWFLLKFDTRWVPAGMNTMLDIPAGSWVIVDRWSSGLRVGSDVFIETPHGELVSRVAALPEGAVVIEHPNPDATWGDSRVFGELPRSQVLGTIVVAFAPDQTERGR
ncbi:MAG: S24/S26 family peptidase [Planctomycetes bacterium]|nr:S24/S26 family peptidase [Planctomycetota bacterium]